MSYDKRYRSTVEKVFQTCLLELGQYIEKVIVLYVKCERCRKKGYHVEKNRGQEVISNRKRQCGYSKGEERKMACPKEGKAQQSSIQARALENIAKQESSQRKVRRTFQMLREVQLNVRVEKLDMHKGITIKALLDSSTTGIFVMTWQNG